MPPVMLVGRAEQADLTDHESTNWLMLEHTVFEKMVFQKALQTLHINCILYVFFHQLSAQFKSHI